MPTMVREAWTDERLDDLTKHMDEGFREVREELRLQRGDTARMMAKQEKLDARLEAQQKHMDARLDDLARTMQIGFGLTGAVLAALIGLIATQL